MHRFFTCAVLIVTSVALVSVVELEAKWPRCLCNCFARRACHRGSLRALDRWFERGANLHHTDRLGRTLLHEVALGEGSADVARWLIGRGVESDRRDREDNTAFNFACAKNHYFLMNLLEVGSINPSHDIDDSGSYMLDMSGLFAQSFTRAHLPMSPVESVVMEVAYMWAEHVDKVVADCRLLISSDCTDAPCEVSRFISDDIVVEDYCEGTIDGQ